jgi:hypothetical protein
MTFEQLLNVFWLRPETAMWREIDIRTIESFKVSSPSLQVWDVGVRPPFPVLHKKLEAIESEKLPGIKKEWINTLQHYLEPLRLMDEQLGRGCEPAFHCYIVEK